MALELHAVSFSLYARCTFVVGMDQCISSIVFETIAILWGTLRSIVFPKVTEELWLRTAAEFESLWNIPHCLGAIDGKHVAVRVRQIYTSFLMCHLFTLGAVLCIEGQIIMVQ